MDVARNGEKWERGVLSSSQHAWVTKVSEEEEGKRRREGGNRSLAGQQASSASARAMCVLPTPRE